MGWVFSGIVWRKFFCSDWGVVVGAPILLVCRVVRVFLLVFGWSCGRTGQRCISLWEFSCVCATGCPGTVELRSAAYDCTVFETHVLEGVLQESSGSSAVFNAALMLFVMIHFMRSALAFSCD